jgi:arylsulfatase A-like enzyme
MEPMMEVQTAMVDRLGENIDRLVQHLKPTVPLANTLIFFLRP